MTYYDLSTKTTEQTWYVGKKTSCAHPKTEADCLATLEIVSAW